MPLFKQNSLKIHDKFPSSTSYSRQAENTHKTCYKATIVHTVIKMVKQDWVSMNWYLHVVHDNEIGSSCMVCYQCN